MAKCLIVVESPTKIKTLKKFLGKGYSFASSVGHVRDLPAKGFGIDVENDFEPLYENLPDKTEVIQQLKKAAKEADIVYLAPDPDREGEAIAWHIAALLPEGTPYRRMTFNAITKNAVLEALEHPRDIDLSLVNAQQARRLLDRIVGYKISPLLTRRVQGARDGGLSAGRVQSVALKLVVDREKEIEAFVPVEYWNLSARLQSSGEKAPFSAYLYAVDGKKVEKEAIAGKEVTLISDKKTAKSIQAQLEKASYNVAKIEKKEKKRNPVPPFITSTLQQEASRHYGFSSARTMGIAQGLYEGLDLGHEGSEGLITYMRTDSVRVAPEAIAEARAFILEKYGQDYLPEKPIYYATKKTSQDAHEAIRPTSLRFPPETIKKYLSEEQFKLYLLIWRRFVASQMTPAIYDTVTCDIATNVDMMMRTTGSTLKFPGFLAVYREKIDSVDDDDEHKEDALLPYLTEGDALSLLKVDAEQSFTKAPPRFTEASLVKELEKSGIGRPSTYASIMNKIQSRDYTTKEKGSLKPTELGRVIAQMLEENFQMIMNINFTASMEDALEEVEEEKRDWKELIRSFWKEFIPTVEAAEKDAFVPKVLTEIPCPDCGKPLQKIWSKRKYFYGCSDYPECKFTTPIEALDFKKEDYDPNFDWNQPCPKCGKEMKMRHGRYGPFLGCTDYPTCRGIVNIPKKGEAPAEDMPNCPAIGCNGKLSARRSRFGKVFYSCSEYPDCDVIVNSLDDLETKYAHHPKTPYEKKTTGKRGAAKKTTAKGTKKAPAKGTKKAPAKSTKKEPKAKTSSQPKKQLSPELAAIVGETSLSRPEVVKKMWEYIKEHGCQDEKNKKTIVPDAKLAKVLGKEPIDMMKLAGKLTKHIS